MQCFGGHVVTCHCGPCVAIRVSAGPGMPEDCIEPCGVILENYVDACLIIQTAFTYQFDQLVWTREIWGACKFIGPSDAQGVGPSSA